MGNANPLRCFACGHLFSPTPLFENFSKILHLRYLSRLHITAPHAALNPSDTLYNRETSNDKYPATPSRASCADALLERIYTLAGHNDTNAAISLRFPWRAGEQNAESSDAANSA
jgi:hypothetical protein